MQCFQINQLREKTRSQIVFYSGTDLRPKHPNHQRKWNAKNLKCTKCEGECTICRAPCCGRYKAFVDCSIGYDMNNPTSETTEVIKLATDIDNWVGKTGVDEPTFMRCSECNAMVCPNCCSVCPIRSCQDRMCKVRIEQIPRSE